MADLTPFRRRRHDITPSEFFRGFFPDTLFDDSFFADFMSPALGKGFRSDIKENEKEYIVEAELPGVKKDQVEINLENNILTISAKQEDVVNEEKDNYIRRERRYGQLRRSFVVENIREDQVKAEYKDGILRVILPKKEEGYKRGRRIDIQ